MYFVMYLFSILSAIAAIPVFPTSNSTSSTVGLFVGLIFLSLLFWFLGSSQKKSIEQNEIKLTKKRVEKNKKWERILKETETFQEEDTKNNKHEEEFIGTCAGSILGILKLQLSLLTHIKDVEQNHFTIGYIFGLVDGLMQIKNIDINDDIAWQVMHLVLDGQYSKKDAERVFNIYEEQTKNQNSLLMRGMQVGGEEFFNKLKNEDSPMGLLNYFYDEGDMAPKTLDNDDIEFSVDDEETSLEERLQKLNGLYKKKLITKKAYEEKQAKLLSEL